MSDASEQAGDARLIPLEGALMIETPVGEDCAVVCGSDLLVLARAALQHAGPQGGPMFTWEDVDHIRGFANDYDSPAAAWLLAYADRLAALLPPREP